MKRTICWMVILGLVIALGMPRCAKKEKEIKIGAILSMTTKGASYGEKTQKGIEIALEEIKDNFPNMKIKIIYEDSQGDPKTAVAALQKLINIDEVPVIIGPIFSDNVLACAPIANSKKTVLFLTAAVSDKIKDLGDYIFRNRMAASRLSAYLARYCYEVWSIGSIAVVYENSANSIDYKSGFVKKYNDLGGEIVAVENLDKGGSDFRTQITKLKQKRPKAIFITGHAQEIGYFLKQSRELGLKCRFYATGGVESDDLLKIAGNAAEGLIICSEAVDIESSDSIIQNFRRKYKALTNQEPDFFCANGYDALKMIIEAGNKYGFTSDGIKRGLYKIKDFHGVGGIISFDEYGEVTKTFVMKIVRNDAFVLYNEK